MEDHYRKLSKFVIQIKSLYPKTTTVHSPAESIDKEKIYPEDIRFLFEMLVHSITLINKLYRLQNKNGDYISQREDYATALMLISPLFTVKTIDLPESIRKYYQQLTTEIGMSKSFTWKDIQRIINRSKTRCHNIINNLIELKLIKQTGKGYRHIYQYELIPINQKNNKSEIWDEVMEQWEGFKGWVEF